MDQKKGILLESGTNELEIVEFSIGRNKFGINVIKVKEIINPVQVTPVPHSHRNIEGIIELRGEVLPVVDVASSLNMATSETPSRISLLLQSLISKKLFFMFIMFLRFIVFPGTKLKNHLKCTRGKKARLSES